MRTSLRVSTYISHLCSTLYCQNCNQISWCIASFNKELWLIEFTSSLKCSALIHVVTVSSSQPESPAMKKAVSLLSLTTPNSGRKRRRLRETLAQLTKETEISPFPPRKRPSAEHSLSMGSLLDISNTPDTCKSSGGEMNDLACHVTKAAK